MMEEPARTVVQVKPWHNKNEFIDVYEALYSDDLSRKQWALNRIDVWKCREQPALPTAIDATAALVRAMVQHDLYDLGLSVCRMPEIGLLHSSALIRFINITTECVQNKVTAVPLRVAARKLGIPQWIIDLRNTATHSTLPSLSMLKHASETALKYLEMKYWQNMGSCFDNFLPVNSISQEANMAVLITHCLERQYVVLKLSENKSSATKKKYQAHLNIIRNEIKNALEHRSAEFFDVLLQPSQFLNASEVLRKFLSESEYEFLTTHQGLCLPPLLEHLWAPIIDLINAVDQMEEFVVRLLKSQKGLEQVHQKIACTWALKLINIVLNEDSLDYSDPIAAIYRKKIWWFDWHYLIGVCAMSPSIYIPAILPVIIDCADPPLSEERKCSIMGTLAIYLGAVPHKIETKNARTYSWEELQDDVELQLLANGRKNVTYVKNKWSEAIDDVDWASIPLGHVFDSVSEFIPPVPVSEDTVMDQSSVPDDQNKVSVSSNDTTSENKVTVSVNTGSQEVPKRRPGPLSSKFIENKENIRTHLNAKGFDLSKAQII